MGKLEEGRYGLDFWHKVNGNSLAQKQVLDETTGKACIHGLAMPQIL